MITIKLVGGAKKSFNSEQLQIEKSDLSVNELLEHLLKIKPSNTSELDIENLLIAINGSDSSAMDGKDTMISNGDTVSIIPIIHGGSSKKLSYKANIEVKQKNIKIWPFILEELESLPFVLEVNVISISKSEGRVNVKFMGDKKAFFQAAGEKKIIFDSLKSGQYVLVDQ